MSKVLLAGESWISTTTEYKGYDSFTSTKLEIGCADLLAALKKLNHEVTHLRAHDVPEHFPWTMDELNQYEVIILSDIGSNSFALSDGVFAGGNPSVNRLQLLKDWVIAGGSLMMAGGYLSFSGFEGKAHYHKTPIEDILPVEILPYDDRIEAPQGLNPIENMNNSISSDLGAFPPILGYQELIPKKDSSVLLTVDSSPLLITGTAGKGKTLAYATDIAPHWATQEFMQWNNYGEFFSRCINWLSGDLS
ncbi:glutamine amidotransferase [Paucilactobacillus nenjiangensis]|uniref:glutamine amidotransferase n=1 Tax=Paucilactobacillus nenjiangensis TaxID=1296540 RepID=UPI0010F9633F|nr:glutamine amidotransferase [Paucilactobacillus nenjiangensis]